MVDIIRPLNNQKMSQGNTTVAAAVVAALIGGLVGYFLGSGGGGSVLPGGRVAELEAQIARAKQFFPTIPELRTTSGVVKKVSGSTITIDADPSPNPFETWPKTREIVVGKSTRIIIQQPKDPALYQKEFDAYQKQVSRGPGARLDPLNIPNPPMSFEEREVKINEIDVGSRITADAATNIKDAARFEATRILVQSTPAVGFPTAGAGAIPPGTPAASTLPPAPAPTATPPASATGGVPPAPGPTTPAPAPSAPPAR